MPAVDNDPGGYPREHPGATAARARGRSAAALAKGGGIPLASRIEGGTSLVEGRQLFAPQPISGGGMAAVVSEFRYAFRVANAIDTALGADADASEDVTLLPTHNDGGGRSSSKSVGGGRGGGGGGGGGGFSLGRGHQISATQPINGSGSSSNSVGGGRGDGDGGGGGGGGGFSLGRGRQLSTTQPINGGRGDVGWSPPTMAAPHKMLHEGHADGADAAASAARDVPVAHLAMILRRVVLFAGLTASEIHRLVHDGGLTTGSFVGGDIISRKQQDPRKDDARPRGAGGSREGTGEDRGNSRPQI